MSVHVVPAPDVIEHEMTLMCVCGPRLDPVEQPDGQIGWIHTHHALDDRDPEPTEVAEPAAPDAVVAGA